MKSNRIKSWLDRLFYKKKEVAKEPARPDRRMFLTHPPKYKQAVIFIRHYGYNTEERIVESCGLVSNVLETVLLRRMKNTDHDYRAVIDSRLNVNGWEVAMDLIVVDADVPGPIGHLLVVPDPMMKSNLLYYSRKFDKLSNSDMGGGSLEEAYCTAVKWIVKDINTTFNKLTRGGYVTWSIRDTQATGCVDKYVNDLLKPKLSVI